MDGSCSAGGVLAGELEIAPAFGEVVELDPNLLWTRMPLPMKVGHVNVYLIRDAGGWLAVDAGFASEKTFEAWERLLAGRLKGEPLTGLVVTHSHIDHIGAAGWLCRRAGIPLYMSEVEYLVSQLNLVEGDRLRGAGFRAVFRRWGVPRETVEAMADYREQYASDLSTLPDSVGLLAHNGQLKIGERVLETILGPGHSPAQAILYCRADGWMLSADHVLGRAPPLLVVPSFALQEDTLGRYLSSLSDLRAVMPDGVHVFPSHGKPHRDLPGAAAGAFARHDDRLAAVEAACAASHPNLLEIAKLLFGNALNGRQALFAVFETLAYTNHLAVRGRLKREAAADGVEHFHLVNPAIPDRLTCSTAGTTG